MKITINREVIPERPEMFELPIPAKETMKEKIYDFLLTVLEVLGEFLVDTIGAIALIGSGLCILLKIAGWDDGYKWAGILMVVNILIKYLLGG